MARNNVSVIGFADDAAILRIFAKRFGVRPLFAKTATYPAGEMALSGPAEPGKHMTVVANIKETPDSLFRVLLLAEALRAAGAKRLDLVAPWIAYGRQDRAVQAGEAPAGIVVARLLSSAFNKIVTLDAHSERFQKAFGGKLANILPSTKLLMPIVRTYDFVAAPDRGANGRTQRIAKAARLPMIQFVKKHIGRTVSVKAEGKMDVRGKCVLLIDDLVDSGATLIAAARVLRSAGAEHVDAFVTHAVDLKVLKRRTRGWIGSVQAAFDHASGDYAEWLM